MNIPEFIHALALKRIQGSNWLGFSVFIAMNIYAGIYFVRHGEHGTKFDKVLAFFSGFAVTHFFLHVYEASSAIPIYAKVRSIANIPQLRGVWWWQWTGVEFLVAWNWRRLIKFRMLGIWFIISGIYATIIQYYFGTTAMNTLIGWNLIWFYLIVYIPNWLALYIVYTKGFFK